jgi:carboxylesterase
MKSLEMIAGKHAVLLIHGLQGVPTEMLPLAKGLHKAGYSVRVPHFKGYGYTEGGGPRSVTPWREWREQVLLELRDMRRQYRTVYIGGLCMGAVLALSVAEEAGDDIAGLALLSTTLFYDGWSIPWYRFLLPLGYYTPFRYLYQYRGRKPFGIKNEKLQQWVLSQKNAMLAAATNLTLPAIHEAELLIGSTKRNLGRVVAPALIVHAADDDVSTLRSADFVADHIGSDKVVKIVLHNSYHMVTLDNERDRVVAETVKFFDDMSGPDTQRADAHGRPVLTSAPHLELVHAA